MKKCLLEGAKTLPELYDKCGAGVGPCGGSCREDLKRFLREKTTGISSDGPGPTELRPELIEALSLFNRRYYWETHEVLEEVWLQEAAPLKTYLQGLIQGAATLYHVLNANPTGVLKLSESALQKFANFPETYHGIFHGNLLQALKEYQKQAREILAQDRAGFDYTRLPYLLHGKSMTVPTEPGSKG